MSDRFYIKSGNEFWTGRTWTEAVDEKNGKRPYFAREYSFEEGLAVIKQRWSRGRQKRTQSGEAYMIRSPILERCKCKRLAG